METNQKPRPRVLIGSLSKDNVGPIPIITRAFMDGLKDQYMFIPHYSNRKSGTSERSSLSIVNFYYFVKHLYFWLYEILKYQPEIAHYPVTSYWNLEKSLIFLMMAKLFSVKAVAHLHGGSFDIFWSNLSSKRKKFAATCLRRLNAIIVLSEGWKNWIINEIGIENRKVMVVNNPIDKQFEETALTLESSENGNLFFLGSLGKRKGVFDILNAALSLTREGIDYKLILAGPEAQRGDLERIKSFIDRYKLDKVTVLEPVHGEQKNHLFKENNIFLFPSYNENFPLVIIEAAAAGKAIITTKTGALPEFFINGESVLFVEPGNVQQILDSINQLLNNKEKRTQIGNAARKTFLDCLSRKNILISLDKSYKMILNNKV